MTEKEFAGFVLGRRFACDFFVAGVGPGPVAILEMRGRRYTITLDELRTLVERGFVVELTPQTRRRES